MKITFSWRRPSIRQFELESKSRRPAAATAAFISSGVRGKLVGGTPT